MMIAKPSQKESFWLHIRINALIKTPSQELLECLVASLKLYRLSVGGNLISHDQFLLTGGWQTKGHGMDNNCLDKSAGRQFSQKFIFGESPLGLVPWLLLASCACLLLQTGCISSDDPKWTGPRIYSIGRQGTLSYDQDTPLIIPIEGKKLADTLRYSVDVTLGGTFPLVPGDYSFDKSQTRSNSDVLNVVISTNYLRRVKTGDSIDLAVHVHEFNPAESALSGVVRAMAKETLDDQDLNNVSAGLDYLSLTLQKANVDRRVSKDSSQAAALKGGLEILKAKIPEFQQSLLIISTNMEELKYVTSKKEKEHASVISASSERRLKAKLLSDFLNVEIPASTNDSIKKLFKGLSDSLLAQQTTQVGNRVANLAALNTAYENLGSLGSKYSQLASLLQGYNSAEVECAKAEMRYGELENKFLNLQSQFQASRRAFLRQLQSSVVSVSDDVGDVVSRFDRTVSTASRTFTLYQVEKFRDSYQAKRVLPANIMAFPEPQDEAEKLFGESVADHYFVVRLSIRNTENEDRLVSTGMIRARGRALVEPKTSPIKDAVGGDSGGRFTVPVEVAPHSAQQVYAVVSDRARHTTRNIVFRGLELAGTVASAYTLTFGAVEGVKDAIQLSTGVGVPAFSKFWVDSVPGYQRNIVNFAMDDLVKVPKNGVTSHKFLFFPKDALEGLIIDQHSYGGSLNRVDPASMPTTHFVRHAGFKQPNAHIAYLIFDDLEVPFENVFSAEPSDARQSVLELKVKTDSLVAFIKDIQNNWLNPANGNSFDGKLGKIDIDPNQANKVGGIIRRLEDRWLASETNLAASATNRFFVSNTVAVLSSTLACIRPERLKADGEMIGLLPGLILDAGDLDSIRSEMLSGKPLSRFSTRIAEIEQRVKNAGVLRSFYSAVADLFADQALIKKLEASLSHQVNEPAALDGLSEALGRLQLLREILGTDAVARILPSLGKVG